MKVSALSPVAACLLSLTLSVVGCVDETVPAVAVVDDCPNPGLIDDASPAEEYIAAAEDFDCFLARGQANVSPEKQWYPVRRFYLKNVAGRTQEALDVACGRKAGPYPAGTFLQLIPLEAMVKRGGTFAPEAGGWEFFALDLSDTASATVSYIFSRGHTATVNQFDGNCFDCHRMAKPEADFICESTNGCDPIPLNDDLIRNFQNGDPRCPPEVIE